MEKVCLQIDWIHKITRLAPYKDIYVSSISDVTKFAKKFRVTRNIYEN